MIALIAGLLGELVGANLHSGSTSTGPPSGTAVGTAPGTASVCNASQVATGVLPSLVMISVASGRTWATGSGSVIDASGDIITNNHVVELGTQSGGTITVDLARGASNVPATLVGRDPFTDVAVIKVGRAAGSLTPITIGCSAGLIVGQPVVALGSPLGRSDTVTTGVVSALDRVINVGSSANPSVLIGAIQTDASINPGNSGGPLVDCQGHQVGINSAGASPGAAGGGGSVDLNSAIPMDFAMAEAQQMISKGTVRHASIGLIGAGVRPRSPRTRAFREASTSSRWSRAAQPQGPASSRAMSLPRSTAKPRRRSATTSWPSRPSRSAAQRGVTLSRGGQTQTVLPSGRRHDPQLRLLTTGVRLHFQVSGPKLPRRAPPRPRRV